MENLDGTVFVKFKTKEKAQHFVDWFDGGGEQAFNDHLDCIGESRCSFNYNGFEITERD